MGLDGGLHLGQLLHGLVQLGLLVVHDLLRAAYPGTLAEYLLHVLGEYHLAGYQQVGQLVVALLVLGEYLLGAVILLVYHLEHLLVYELGGAVGVGPLELVFLVVVVADVGQPVAHAGVGYHAVGALRGALQVVHGSRGDVPREEFLGGASSEQGAHLVEHLLLGGDLPLLGQVPGGSQGLSAGHDAHLHQGVGVLAEPGDGGVAGLVEGDGALLLGGHHLGFLLQSAYDAVHGVQEVLLAHGLAVVAGGYQRGLVAHVGDVGPREARGLPGQQVYVHRVVHLHGPQVHLEYLLALRQVGQVYVYLPVEAAGAEQRGV